MTLIDDIAATNDVALAVAAALEQVLGDDVILAVGVAAAPGSRRRHPARRRDARRRRCRSRDGVVGEVALVVGEQLATAMEARARRRARSRRARPRRSKPAPTAMTSRLGRPTRSHARPSATEVADRKQRHRAGRRRPTFIVYPLLGERRAAVGRRLVDPARRRRPPSTRRSRCTSSSR